MARIILKYAQIVDLLDPGRSPLWISASLGLQLMHEVSALSPSVVTHFRSIMGSCCGCFAGLRVSLNFEPGPSTIHAIADADVRVADQQELRNYQLRVAFREFRPSQLGAAGGGGELGATILQICWRNLIQKLFWTRHLDSLLLQHNRRALPFFCKYWMLSN